MFDTYLTVTGNALTTPEKKTTTKTNTVVASFRVASHTRRFDKNTQEWVDGPNLRIKVNCWRRLADNVCGSIVSGDPVVVYGRIATREWLNDQGETRLSYEIEADAVGHDLSRGRSTFKKMRSDLNTTVIEDDDSQNRVHGEPTTSLPRFTGAGRDVEESYDDFPSAGDGYSSLDDPDGDPDGDAMSILRRVGLDLSDSGGGGDGADGDAEDDTDEEAMAGAAVGSGGPAGRSRRRGRQPVPA